MASVLDLPAASAPSRPGLGVYRLTLEEYDRLIAAGVVPEGNRVFLLHGVLVSKIPMTQDPIHFRTIQRLGRLLEERCAPARWSIRAQGPLVLPDGVEGCPSVPEPDLLVARGPEETYDGRHPLAGDVALIAEVVTTSARKDALLLPCYGFAGIPTVWIVDVQRRTVTVYRSPTTRVDAVASGYTRVMTYVDGADREIPLEIGDIPPVGTIPLRAIFPAAPGDGAEPEVI